LEFPVVASSPERSAGAHLHFTVRCCPISAGQTVHIIGHIILIFTAELSASSLLFVITVAKKMLDSN
jgi:hypothetical protein